MLLHRARSVGQFRESLRLFDLLGYFPRIGGTLAVLSGIALVFAGDYSFKDFWIYGGLIIYVLIQLLFIVFVLPLIKKTTAVVNATDLPVSDPMSEPLALGASRINSYFYVCSVLAILLFVFMFFKPTI